MTVGHGKASAVPDRFLLHAALSARAGSAADVLHRIAELNERAVAALDATDMATDQRATTSYAIQPVHDPRTGDPQGYEATMGLRLSLTNASAVADVTSRLVNQVGDALRVHGLGRTFADPSPLFAEARAAAVRAAREQAEQIADAAGARIARLVSLVEGPPATDAGFFAFAAASPRPVSRAPEVHPGETEVHVLRPGYAFRWHYGDAGRRSPCQRQPKIDPADSRDPRNDSVSQRL